ncbi:MAG: hypothetical protein NTW32_23975 [Chloroflexi bacterium]|nr:hypothetical protein [Chloroflexota bacterium]
MDNRPGCLSGLFKLFIIEKIFGWLQQKIGFGRGGICGCGCGFFLFLILVGLLCSVVTGTDWTRFGF